METNDTKHSFNTKGIKTLMDNFFIRTVDRKGNDLEITVKGVDDRELAHFGGLDLHLKATKAMIADANTLSFPEKDGDYAIREKVAALYINEIGEFLRNTSHDPDFLNNISNMELVRDFLITIENPEVLQVIEKDNDLIKTEALQLEQEEEDIWSNVMAIIKKNKE